MIRSNSSLQDMLETVGDTMEQLAKGDLPNDHAFQGQYVKFERVCGVLSLCAWPSDIWETLTTGSDTRK